jgi:CHAT domain-containing protein
MRAVLLFVFLALSTFSFSQKIAEDNYNEGLKLVSARKSKIAITKFYEATKQAIDGSEIQLKAIFKLAHYYNYADENLRPEVLRWTLIGLKHVRRTSRKDTLAAFIFYRAGRAYQLNYKADSALLIYEEARKRLEGFYGSKSMHVAECILLMGEVKEFILRDYSEGEMHYEKALAIMEQLPVNEETTYYVFELYRALAIINGKQRDYEKALVYGLRNVAYAETIPYPKYLEESYLKLAVCYRDLNQTDSAKLFFRKAIAVNIKRNEGKPNPLLADHYYEMGITLQKEGKLDEAINNYSGASKVFEATSALKNSIHIQCEEKLGIAYTLKKKYTNALIVFRKGLKLLKVYQLESRGPASGFYLSFGDYFREVNQIDSALVYYQKSIIAASQGFKLLEPKYNPEIDKIYQQDYCLQSLIRKASIFSDLFNKTKNRDYAKQALQSYTLAEQLLTLGRSELDLDESKWNFMDANFRLYENALSLLYTSQQMVENEIDQCFFFMESSKSKSLSDALAIAQATDEVMASDSALQFLSAQKRQIHNLRDQINEFTEQGNSGTEIEKLRYAMVDADRKIQIMEAKINEKYPTYLPLKYSYKLPSLDAVKEYTRKNKICVIEYFWGLDDVYALGIFGDNIRFKKLGSSDTLEKKINAVRQFLTSRKNSFDQKTVISFSQNSFGLYQDIISPFSDLISLSKRLVVVPDGILSQLPLEVLTKSSGGKSFHKLDYLINDHIVSYAFSSAYLLQPSPLITKDNRMLAFAFTGGNTMRSFKSTNGLNELTGSDDELRSLHEKFSDGTYLTGLDVTETNFKTMSPEYSLLHLAVHGRGDPDKDYSSALFFRDSASQDDGKLHWYELLGLRLKARLAVISSCESGIGKEYRGEGMLSMASAFAYAGCSNVVMGMWKVDDRVSALLMNKFYKNLKEGKTVDEALGEAKKAYLNNADGLMANPKLWASLVAYGNHNVLQENESHLFYWMFLIVLLVIAVIYIRVRFSN